MKRKERRAQWSALVSEWESSGASALAWCRERQLNYAAFLRWRKRLEGAGTVVPSGFVELVVAESGPGCAVILDFGHGLRMELPPGFDDATLRRAVVALRECWR